MKRIPICNCRVAAMMGGLLLFYFIRYLFDIPDFSHQNLIGVLLSMLLGTACVLAAMAVVITALAIYKKSWSEVLYSFFSSFRQRN